MAQDTEQAALQTFVRFTEAAGQIGDLDELARLALRTLQTLIPGAHVVITELTSTHWRLRHWTDNLDPELLAMARQHGFPLSTPVFAELLETGEPSFTNGWDEATQGVPHTEQFQAVAHYPIVKGGQIVAAIGLAVTHQQVWTEVQRAIIRSVGRSFSLLYERVAGAEQLRRQREQAEHRARALEALMQLTYEEDTPDPATLIRRTQQLVLELLPPGYAAYFEPEDGRWRLRVQSGHAGSEALQAALDAGFPVGGTPTLDLGAQTREALFVDVYDHAADIDPEVAGHLNAAACLPLLVRGQVRGIFNVPLFETQTWTADDRALLITAVHTLGLVIERSERTAELGQTNRELLSANEELEAFTYSVSHDLRAPVRHVQGFSEMARRALSKADPVKATAHLQVIEDGAHRMSAMIDALLDLARSARTPLTPGPVDLGRLVTLARQDVAPELAGRDVEWMIAPLPTVWGDAGTLQQVMTNLLANAVKFTRTRDRARIEVWAGVSDTEITVGVRDNGVGFEPQYAARLFGAFQRLHTEREFEGTGIGLATVRRILLRHGGRVAAEGRPGEGATFTFTLPQPPEASHD